MLPLKVNKVVQRNYAKLLLTLPTPFIDTVDTAYIITGPRTQKCRGADLIAGVWRRLSVHVCRRRL